MSSSFIQQLKLGSVSIEDEFEMAIPGALARHGWPLPSFISSFTGARFIPLREGHLYCVLVFCAIVLRL
jgi:hypothetical protein